jgi:CspA family cold shock protein
MEGTVVWFDDLKGFGFIRPAEEGDDVFVHFTGIAPPDGGGRRSLRQGQTVSYELGSHAGRTVATEVVVVSEE